VSTSPLPTIQHDDTTEVLSVQLQWYHEIDIAPNLYIPRICPTPGEQRVQPLSAANVLGACLDVNMAGYHIIAGDIHADYTLSKIRSCCKLHYFISLIRFYLKQ
jgi:hypothetical protein